MSDLFDATGNIVPLPTTPVRRRRARPDHLDAEKRQKIAERVVNLYQKTLADRSEEEGLRIQRYAKYRMWREEKDWPWEGASNLPMPDITEKSLRLQDTIHNAFMSQRPPFGAKALDKSGKDKEPQIDKLLDFQFFVEQNGEQLTGDLAEAFVNEGVFTAFIPWVRDRKEITDKRIFDPIPETEQYPDEYFATLLDQAYPGAAQLPAANGWDWTIMPETGEPVEVSFYTRPNGEVEMISTVTTTIYDGPRVIPYAWADVFHPVRAANLQPPGPANRNGAAFVILRDQGVGVDEIKRLSNGDDPFYDLVTPDDLAKILAAPEDTSEQRSERVKDDLSGSTYDPSPYRDDGPPMRSVTRLLCFDRYDIDGSGSEEDMVWWVFLETKTLARARRLTEAFPASPPRRPFAEAAFLPIEGRRCGMSLPELMEGIHDATKALFDQVVDSGTLKIVPPFFYRATGGIKPETMRMWPGEGYPLSDPRNDIYFPQFATNVEVMSLNTMAALQAMGERLTTIGDLNLGRVPAGKASALRTASGISMIAGQGEARPERIMRRFFMGFAEVWKQMLELDQRFLPKDKQFRIIGYHGDGQELFHVVRSPNEIEGRFAFDFSANALNTTKAGMRDALVGLMQAYVTPLALQLGIVKPDSVYRLFRDLGQALGQDPDRYLSPPSPDSLLPPIFAEEAISAMISGNMPQGRPAEVEGAVEHFQKLLAFAASDDFGHLPPQHVDLFRKYLLDVKRRAIEDERRKQMMAAAAQFQQQQQQGGQGAGQVEAPPGNPQEPAPVGENQLSDESMPGAGGGANPGGPYG